MRICIENDANLLRYIYLGCSLRSKQQIRSLLQQLLKSRNEAAGQNEKRQTTTWNGKRQFLQFVVCLINDAI